MRLTAFACVLGLAIAAATRPALASGVYVSLTTSDAAACARACADDGICMAWSFHRDNKCQLTAVVSSDTNPEALASGFASRAPASLRRAPPVQIAAVLAAAPAQANAAPPAAEPPAGQAEHDDGLLLGGPDEGDLRLSLH